MDVTAPRSTADLAAGTATTTEGVPCSGDGTSGKRVQAVYVHAANVLDRYAAVVGLIGQWAANADQTFADSAAETGGTRHVRWVTDSACNLAVERVQVTTTGDDSYAATASELQALGFTRSDRKYLLWVDANVYCGIAGIRSDDRMTSDNANDVGPRFARVDAGCWGSVNPVEAHELMHNLGGVQNTAPHASGGWHCTDEYDRMCYSDASGVTMSYVCATAHERLFDCNHADFFSTAPRADTYLSSHWNAASSGFLEAAPTSPTSSTVPPPTTSSTTSPSTTLPRPPAVLLASGTLSRKAPSQSYSVTSGAGPVLALLTFTRAPTLTLELVDPNGAPVLQVTGRSPARLSVTVVSGRFTLLVSGSTNAAFTLTLTYPSP